MVFNRFYILAVVSDMFTPAQFLAYRSTINKFSETLRFEGKSKIVCEQLPILYDTIFRKSLAAATEIGDQDIDWDQVFTKLHEPSQRIAEERLPAIRHTADQGQPFQGLHVAPRPQVEVRQDSATAMAAEQMRKTNEEILKRQEAMLQGMTSGNVYRDEDFKGKGKGKGSGKAKGKGDPQRGKGWVQSVDNYNNNGKGDNWKKRPAGDSGKGDSQPWKQKRHW